MIRNKLQHRPPQLLQPLNERAQREAAVLMALTDSCDPSMVFIRRAEHLSSHQGQVAFPGGMWEPEDNSLLDTALRESEEEIALPRSCVEVIATLEPRVTRFAVRVSPFVGVIPEGLEFVPELSELDAVFEVPLSFLLDGGNYRRKQFRTAGGVYEAPCIFYNNYCIWGFTFGLVQEVLSDVFDFQPAVSTEAVAVKV